MWLDHQVIEGPGGGLLINWDVARGVFPEGLVDDVFAAHGAALQWLAEHDDWRSPLPLPLPAAQAAVRERVNDTGDDPPDGRLHDAFFAWARRAPAVRDHRQPAVVPGFQQSVHNGPVALPDGSRRIGERAEAPVSRRRPGPPPVG